MNKYPTIVIQNKENKDEFEVNPTDKTLSKLLSPDGFIKAGEIIIQIDGNIIKSIDSGDAYLSTGLKIASKQNPIENISFNEIIQYKESESPDGMQKANTFEWSGYEKICFKST